MVQELMRRLEEESIDAFNTPERGVGEIYSGTSMSIAVFISQAQHLQRAAQILREVRAQQTFIRCPHCDYDLRGHAGDAVCPECGRMLTAPAPDVECPDCGEAVPAGFDVCWNCGAAMPGPPPWTR
jgi:rubrerythrin